MRRWAVGVGETRNVNFFSADGGSVRRLNTKGNQPINQSINLPNKRSIILSYPEKKRSIKKGAFLVLRQSFYTVQATVFVGGDVGRPMVQYSEDISKESVIDVRGKLVVTPSPVSGCTQKDVELKIEEVCGGVRGNKKRGQGQFLSSGSLRAVYQLSIIVYFASVSEHGI